MKKGDLVQVIGTTEIRKVTYVGNCDILDAGRHASLDSPVKGWKIWPLEKLQVVKGKRGKK
jgi:hypothetical protein